VSISFSPTPSKPQCFFLHSSLLAIGFHSCFFFNTDVSAPNRSTLLLLTFRWVSRLGTDSGNRCCGPRGGAGVCLEQKSRSKFLPWTSLRAILAATNVNTIPPSTMGCYWNRNRQSRALNLSNLVFNVQLDQRFSTFRTHGPLGKFYCGSRFVDHHWKFLH